MTQDEIIEMARQANLTQWDDPYQRTYTANVTSLSRFAKLVAAKEREDIWEMACDYTQRYNSHVCLVLADAIRARGEA